MNFKKWYSNSIFSCKKFAERMSESYDRNLSPGSKFCFVFHYLMCFTCRRVKKQIDLVNLEIPKLADSIPSETQLSEEAKNRIRTNLCKK